MFANSDKAQHDLWVKDINTKNLTQITRDYDMEYCTSAGDCVTFRRNEKATHSLTAKVRFQAGIGMGCNKLEPVGNALLLNPINMSCIVPQVGVGLDFLFPRSSKHWSIQSLVLLSKWSMSKDYKEYDTGKYWDRTGELKYLNLEGQIGLAYSFMPDSKFSPILRGGLAIDQPLATSDKGLYNFSYIYGGDTDRFSLGFYVGAGVDIAVQKHIIRVSADFKRTNLPDVITKYIFSLNAGIRL